MDRDFAFQYNKPHPKVYPFRSRKELISKPSIGCANKKIKKKLSDIYGLCCFYCGLVSDLSNFTIDHLIPKSKGGRNCLSNYVLACFSCNQDKGNLMPLTYINIINKRRLKNE
jgi:5-methylcytosine-specific restriction endonuclease McrA